MKKLVLFLVLLVGLSNKLNAQIPVTDAAANANIAESNTLASQNLAKNTSILAKAVATLKTLTDMKSQYDKWDENIEEVSNAIETGKQISNIFGTLEKINSNYQKAINYINQEQLIHPVEKGKFISAFTTVVGECIDDMDDAYKLSTTGSYKMTDAERMNLLKDIQNNLNDQNSFIIYFLQKIKKSVNITKSKVNEKEFIKNANQSFKN